MAIEVGTKFIGISADVDMAEKKSALSNDQTAVYTIDEIKGYKVYTALLTQSGIDAPIATVLENTFEADIIWEYTTIGGYRATISGYSFDENNTFTFITNNNDTSVNLQSYVTGGGIEVFSYLLSNGTGKNNTLLFTPIEIRVYN